MTLRWPTLLLALALCACGPSDPKTLTDQGAQALGAGRAEEACEAFEDALDHMDPQHPLFLRASLGRLQALARLEPTRALDEFLAFHTAQGAKVQDVDFKLLGDEFIKRGSFRAATELIKAAKLAYPASPVVEQLGRAAHAAAKQAGDGDSVSGLAGLGYGD